MHVQVINLGEGTAQVETGAREDLYYQVLEEIVGQPLEGKHTMMRLMRDLTFAKGEYDKVAGALAEVRQVGYGMVPPRIEEMTFDEPELVKQGEELVQYLMDRFQENPAELWDFDIFGKKLSDLVREGIASKLHRMPDNAQMKLQETLSRIINEGSGGLIAIII